MRQLSCRIVVAALGCAAGTASPATAAAQRGSVSGTVAEAVATPGAPRLAAAEVRLTRVGPEVPRTLEGARATYTDSVGAFAFAGLAPGAYRIDVRQLGHEPFADTVIVPAGEAVRLLVAMRRAVPQLERVVTTAAAGYRARLLQTSGFRERQRVGFGHFIDGREIDRLQPPSVYSLLRPYLRGCTMMYVNGARAPVPPGLTVAELVGVEIYRRNLGAPAEFQNPLTDCGSIVLWTAIPVDGGGADASPP